MNGPSPRISDNPTQQELLKKLESAEALLVLFGLSGKLGIEPPEFAETVKKLVEHSKMAQEHVHIPDRFNDHFADRGWIAHKWLDVDLAKKAIGLANTGKFDEAERLLVDHYDQAMLDFVIQRCKLSDAFRPRWELAQAAKTEYLEQRWYSAIPLVLMLIDGFVNEIQRTGFFARGTDLTASDSIAGHSSGLAKLSKLFGCERNKTTTEPLTVPYRHGILHGWDLGYANKIVAAKAWACLAALSEWALQVGKKPPKPQAPLSRDELLTKLQQIEQCEIQTAAWKPRAIDVGKTIPAAGMPSDYQNGTPERAMVCLLCHWKAKNYGKMASLLCGFGGRVSNTNRRAGEVRENFGLVELNDFRIIEVTDDVRAVSTIRLVLNYAKYGKQKEAEVSVHLWLVNENGQPPVCPNESKTWVVLEADFNKIILSS